MNTSAMTAHELLSRELQSYVEAAKRAHARVLQSAAALSAKRRSKPGGAVGEGADDPAEAVHDFRVALRRLRTMLKPARRVYGRRALREIGMVLKHYADMTGPLRDEEVLHETLAKLLMVEGPHRASLDRFLAGRTKHEQALRRQVTGMLSGQRRAGSEDGKAGPALLVAGLEETLERLSRRLERPRKLGGMEAELLGREAIEKVQTELRDLGEVDPHDGEAMHEKRIFYKRLRYTAELFGTVLGEEGEKLMKHAAKQQNRLGRLHDVDMALLCVQRARSIKAAEREALMKALRGERAEALRKCLGE